MWHYSTWSHFLRKIKHLRLTFWVWWLNPLTSLYFLTTTHIQLYLSLIASLHEIFFLLLIKTTHFVAQLRYLLHYAFTAVGVVCEFAIFYVAYASQGVLNGAIGVVDSFTERGALICLRWCLHVCRDLVAVELILFDRLILFFHSDYFYFYFEFKFNW